jgi:hypothetical protein
MDYPRAQIVRALMRYFGADNRRIEHALRVLKEADRIVNRDEQI